MSNFRILGHHVNGLIILRSYPGFVTVSIGKEVHQFPSQDAALMYLQKMTKQSGYEERNYNDYDKRRT